MDDFEKLMAIIIIGGAAVVLSVLVLGDLKSPTKYDSYNKAILNCSLNKTENERNNCRVQVTKFYMKYSDLTQK